MLEDLVPILEAAKIIPIRVRGGGDDQPVQVNLPRMTRGCFDCVHSTSMSPRRQYATLVGYTGAPGSSLLLPIFGMVVSLEDRGIVNLPTRHWLHESILMASPSTMTRSNWDIDKFQDDDSQIYVRKWVDYRSINGLAHVTGIIDLDTIYDDYLDQFEGILIQTYYNRHYRGMYLEPQAGFHEYQNFDDQQIGNMVRFAPMMFTAAQKREVLSRTWPQFLNLATRTTSPYISLLTEPPVRPGRLVEESFNERLTRTTTARGDGGVIFPPHFIDDDFSVNDDERDDF